MQNNVLICFWVYFEGDPDPSPTWGIGHMFLYIMMNILVDLVVLYTPVSVFSLVEKYLVLFM